MSVNVCVSASPPGGVQKRKSVLEPLWDRLLQELDQGTAVGIEHRNLPRQDALLSVLGPSPCVPVCACVPVCSCVPVCGCPPLCFCASVSVCACARTVAGDPALVRECCVCVCSVCVACQRRLRELACPPPRVLCVCV